MSKISHPCWIRIDRHIMQILTFVCIMTIQSRSIISGVTPYLLTSMATIYFASTTIVVVKSEDLKLFSVGRQLISYQ
jgi:uncharacterized membrane protein